MNTPNQLPAWKALEAHQKTIAQTHMRDFFAKDPGRFEKFSLQFRDILLDFSKNRITDETLRLLLELPRQAKLQDWAARMFNGDKINITEDRAVLHIALRNRSN